MCNSETESTQSDPAHIPQLEKVRMQTKASPHFVPSHTPENCSRNTAGIHLPSRGGVTVGSKIGWLVLTCLLLLGFAPSLLADTVMLQDGTRITGTVTQLSGGKLGIQTKFAGSISIDWTQVASLALDHPLLLVLPAPATTPLAITGLRRSGDAFTVTTAQGTQQMPATSITLLRTQAAQASYLASLHPGWTHSWSGNANVSFAFARGNSNTTTIGSGITVARPTLHDKTSGYFNSLYTHDGILNSTTANTTNAGLRYDHNLNPHLFGFVTQDFNTNALQDLTLRSITGGGVGLHARNTPRQTLDLTSGLVWTHENYSAIPASATQPTAVPSITNSFVAINIGEQFSQKFGASSSLTEQGNMYPNMNQLGQFEANVTATLNTQINKILSWQTTINDIEVTNPPPGTKDNDIILTTGLGFTFSRK